MSRDARPQWGRVGVSFSLFIRSVVLLMLCVLGSGASHLILRVNNPANL